MLFVYARLCLFTPGYVRLFPVMSVRIMLRQTALHTFWIEVPAGSRQSQIKVLPSTNHAGCNIRKHLKLYRRQPVRIPLPVLRQ